MENEWAQNAIKDWVAKGMLSKESVLGRLDQGIQTSYAISEEEKSALKRVFQSVCTQDGLLTEAAFLSLLQTKATLPRSPEGIQAGKVLYTSLAYLSTLPFPRSPELATSQLGLSLDQLTRSLVWALPSRYAYIIEEGPDSRMRTKADHRRLLFQSLASTTHDKPYAPESARRLALRNAFDVDREDDRQICSSNHDDDGDEIYHDLLDVLYSTQEVKHPGISRVPRDAFRLIAKRIATENEIAALHTLGIPTERFVALVRLLLALQLRPAETGVSLTQFDAAAQSVCAAFCEQEAAVITWPMFDRGLRDVAQYLFDPFYHILSITFMGKTDPSDSLDGSDRPSSLGSILTLALLSQLATFLTGSTYFGWFRRIQHYAGPNRPTPTALVSAMETVPDEAVMVLSGTTATGEPCTFGVFSPKPKADGASVQTNVIPDHVGQEPCAIFQLAPVQDIFRGVIGKPGWTVDNDTVMFGQGSGVVMMLKDASRRVEVTHQVAEGDDSTGVYKPNMWRGNWTVCFGISEIEIWSELES